MTIKESYIYRKISIILCLCYFSALLTACQSIGNERKGVGDVTTLEEYEWISADDEVKHNICKYSLGELASEVASKNDSYIMEHLSIDGITFYYYHPNGEQAAPLIFFLHGQGSEKEEYLGDFNMYADCGFSCITLDLAGHGERKSSEPISALDATVTTSENIGTILDYLSQYKDSFAIVGVSQGGSVAYHYAAYGEYTPFAIVVASTSPDFENSSDTSIIVNGSAQGNTDAYSDEYVEQNNPIRNWQQFSCIPLLSGNVVNDPVVSVVGSQSLEQIYIENDIETSTFLYYSGDSHDVPAGFFNMIIDFLLQNAQ